jgi:uncharacterized protein
MAQEETSRDRGRGAFVTEFACRPGCAACCIAPSISSPIPPFGGKPGMPEGKAAGLPCSCLVEGGLCGLFGRPERPAVCLSLKPSAEMCGASREEALAYLAALEEATASSA